MFSITYLYCSNYSAYYIGTNTCHSTTYCNRGGFFPLPHAQDTRPHINNSCETNECKNMFKSVHHSASRNQLMFFFFSETNNKIETKYASFRLIYVCQDGMCISLLLIFTLSAYALCVCVFLVT